MEQPPKRTAPSSEASELLPAEVQAIVLSFLKLQKKLLLSTACTKWREAIKFGSAWDPMSTYVSRLFVALDGNRVDWIDAVLRSLTTVHLRLLPDNPPPSSLQRLLASCHRSLRELHAVCQSSNESALLWDYLGQQSAWRSLRVLDIEVLAASLPTPPILMRVHVPTPTGPAFPALLSLRSVCDGCLPHLASLHRQGHMPHIREVALGRYGGQAWADELNEAVTVVLPRAQQLHLDRCSIPSVLLCERGPWEGDWRRWEDGDSIPSAPALTPMPVPVPLTAGAAGQQQGAAATSWQMRPVQQDSSAAAALVAATEAGIPAHLLAEDAVARAVRGQGRGQRGGIPLYDVHAGQEEAEEGDSSSDDGCVPTLSASPLDLHLSSCFRPKAGRPPAARPTSSCSATEQGRACGSDSPAVTYSGATSPSSYSSYSSSAEPGALVVPTSSSCNTGSGRYSPPVGPTAGRQAEGRGMDKDASWLSVRPQHPASSAAAQALLPSWTRLSEVSLTRPLCLPLELTQAVAVLGLQCAATLHTINLSWCPLSDACMRTLARSHTGLSGRVQTLTLDYLVSVPGHPLTDTGLGACMADGLGRGLRTFSMVGCNTLGRSTLGALADCALSLRVVRASWSGTDSHAALLLLTSPTCAGSMRLLEMRGCSKISALEAALLNEWPSTQSALLQVVGLGRGEGGGMVSRDNGESKDRATREDDRIARRCTVVV